MSYPIRAVIFCVVSMFASGTWGSAPSSEEEALRAADAAWAEAAASGNVDEIVKYWAEDAINYFPGMPPLRGRADIEAFVRQNRSRDAGFSLTWRATEVRLAESGELGYTSGPFTMTSTLPSGERRERTGHYVCIWRKDPDGRWRCIVETSVFDSQPG